MVKTTLLLSTLATTSLVNSQTLRGNTFSKLKEQVSTASILDYDKPLVLKTASPTPHLWHPSIRDDLLHQIPEPIVTPPPPPPGPLPFPFDNDFASRTTMYSNFDTTGYSSAGSTSFGSTSFGSTSAAVRCVSDEECLQNYALSRQGCPQFCVDGFCAPNPNPEEPPVLRLKTGMKVDHSQFKLRSDEELEKLFRYPPQHFSKGELDGRFFEVVEGSPEVLEVKYPEKFFEISARLLESAPGVVDGDKEEAFTHNGDHEDLDGKLDGNSDTDFNDFDLDSFAGLDLTSFGSLSEFGVKRGLKVMGDSPDRWRPSNTAANPWRRNGRLSMGCTAALIGNRVLITAAHCVWDKATNSWSNFPTFAAGQDGNNKPFGDVRVVRMTIPAGYQTCSSGNDCRAHDWAVLAIHRDDRLNVGYFGFSTSKGNSRLNLAGYPASKNRQLWYDHCPLLSDEGKWIKHRCDTEPGNSGSGIYKIVNGHRYVVAVHGGGLPNLWNRGADVDGRTSSAGRLFDRMLAYRREFG